jgi:hypothetical protein
MSAVRRCSLLAAAVCGGVLASPLAGPLAAQSAQRVSIQASGLYVGAYGDAYEGLKPGAGGEAQLRYTPSVWSFGIGGQLSTHDLDGQGFEGQQVKLTGIFFEPRRVIDVGSTVVAPYISARFAYLRQSIDFSLTNGRETVSVEAKASGSQVNAGGGLLFRMSPRVNLDLGATFGMIRFGDVEVNVPGGGNTTVDGSSGTGQNLVIRAGLAIGLGK